MKEIMNKKIEQKLVTVSEYLVSFKIGRFIKFWIYHLLFYYTGFFSIIPITLIDSFSLAKNMHFTWLSSSKVVVLAQMVTWICNVITILIWVSKYYHILPFDIKLNNIAIELFFLY